MALIIYYCYFVEYEKKTNSEGMGMRRMNMGHLTMTLSNSEKIDAYEGSDVLVFSQQAYYHQDRIFPIEYMMTVGLYSFKDEYTIK